MQPIRFTAPVWENWYNPEEVYGVAYEDKQAPALGGDSKLVASKGDAGVIDEAGVVRWHEDAACVGNSGYRYFCRDMAPSMYERL